LKWKEEESETYNRRIVIHLAQELAQTGFLLGRLRRGGDWIDSVIGIGALRLVGIHIDILFDGSVDVGIGLDGRVDSLSWCGGRRLLL
jgi:hypothetical protein